MQQTDTGKALIPWTLESMAIPQLLYMTAAKQFWRPSRSECLVCIPAADRRVVYACLTRVPYHLLCIGEALPAHPWLTCSTCRAQQGGPKACEVSFTVTVATTDFAVRQCRDLPTRGYYVRLHLSRLFPH